MTDHTAEPVSSTPADDCCAGDPDDPRGFHALDCPVYLAEVDELEQRRAAEPLAQGGIVTPDAQPFAPQLRQLVRDHLERERAAYERGKAEGLRQATEGWEREWGVAHGPGRLPDRGDDEVTARRLASYSPERRVLSRLVGPWEPAEQPEPARDVVAREAENRSAEVAVHDAGPDYALIDDQGRCGCCYGTGEHRCGHECYSCDGSGVKPDSPVCTVPHGERCACPDRLAAEQPEGSA